MKKENASPPRIARERTVITQMVRFLEKSEQIQLEVRELERFLLGTEDAHISVRLLSENARDQGGPSRFVLLDTPRGKGGGRGAEVADAVRENQWSRSSMDGAAKIEATSAGRERRQVSREHAWSGNCKQKHGSTTHTRFSNGN